MNYWVSSCHTRFLIKFHSYIHWGDELPMFYLKLLPCHNCTILMNNHRCLTRALKIAYKVCQFGIGTLRLQKREKHFCECIFALLSLKRKINNGFCHVGDLSQIEIKLNWLPLMPFLVYMHVFFFTIKLV